MSSLAKKNKIALLGFFLMLFLCAGHVSASNIVQDPGVLFGTSTKKPFVSVIKGFFDDVTTGLAVLFFTPEPLNVAQVYVTSTITPNSPTKILAQSGLAITTNNPSTTKPKTNTTAAVKTQTITKIITQTITGNITDAMLASRVRSILSEPEFQAMFKSNTAMTTSQLAKNTTPVSYPAPIPAVFMPVGVSQPAPSFNFSGATFFNATDLSSRYFKTSEATIGSLTITGGSSLTGDMNIIGNINFSGALMPNGLTGTAGQVLTSAGIGIAPTWETPSLFGLTDGNGTVANGTAVDLGGTLTGDTVIDLANSSFEVSSGTVGLLLYPGAHGTYFHSTVLGDFNSNGNGTMLQLHDDNSSAFFSNNIGDTKIGINTAAPSVALDVVGQMKLNDANGNLYLGDENTGTNMNFSEGSNIAIGNSAGYMTSPGFPDNGNSVYIGTSAGQNATNAFRSNFFGYQAGQSATNATHSNFFGYQVGQSATNASFSNFSGYQAGQSATNASLSNFFGPYAGSSATNASNSNFLGTNAGNSATNASNSVFIGQNSGYNDTVDNTGNGDDFSVLIGKDTSTGGYKNSIALGGSATNTAENQMMIGSTTRPLSAVIPYGNLGIGTTSPGAKLDVNGNSIIGRAINSSSNANSILYDEAGSGYMQLIKRGSAASGSLGLGTGASEIITDNDLGIWTSSTKYIMFGTSAAERMRITATGNIGIGTTTPNTFKLEVAGNIGPEADNTRDLGSSGKRFANIYATNFIGAITPTGFTQGSVVFAGTGGALSQNNSNFFWDNTNSRLGIGTTGPGAKLDVNGDALINGLTVGKGPVSGTTNTAFGVSTLAANSSGSNNTAIGYQALLSMLAANNNTAVGTSALQTNTGGANTAIGSSALISNTTGNFNTVSGVAALNYNKTGSSNIAIGYQSGYGASNASNISNNVIVGYNAGLSVLTGANNNVFIGYAAAANVTTGAKNIVIGHNIDAPSATTSNQLNIGNIIFGTGVSGTGTTIAGSIGIGENNPTAILHLKAGTVTASTAPLKFTSGTNLTTAEAGAFEFDGTDLFFTPSTVRNTLVRNNTTQSLTAESVFVGYNTGLAATSATYANFFGRQAGYQATNASYSNFLGTSAGYQATNATYSNFFGSSAGSAASGASYSNFFGSSTGFNASSASFSNFFGASAGNTATNATHSNFFGNSAGYQSTNASYSNFFGYYAGKSSPSATHSNFLGRQAGYGISSGSYSNFFGFNVGAQFSGNDVGSNNIIIGTNISLPNATSNAINLGGVLFATGTYATNTGNPSIVPTSGGRVGIGTSSPSFPLEVTSYVASNQSYGFLNPSGVIGTASGTSNYSIRASERIIASEFNAVSDARLKDVQFDLEPSIALDLISQLRPVSFTWKSNPTGQPIIGFLAQDVESVIPNAVSQMATDNFPDQRELSYNQLTAVAIGAIKEINIKIIGIGDLGKTNTFRESLTQWFSNTANGIESFFAKKVNTEELCVKTSTGSSVCINGDQLQQIINNSSTSSQQSNTTSSEQDSSSEQTSSDDNSSLDIPNNEQDNTSNTEDEEPPVDNAATP